jgi:hypothetical protein
MLIFKIIEGDSAGELEKKVNDFLKEKKNTKIFKIANEIQEIKILSNTSYLYLCYITYVKGERFE